MNEKDKIAKVIANQILKELKLTFQRENMYLKGGDERQVGNIFTKCISFCSWCYCNFLTWMAFNS